MEIFKQITANNITLKEYPFWKELAMEAYLLENEALLKLDKTNFNDVSVLDAEIALKNCTAFGDGRVDMVVKYSAEYIGIVEIKLKEINSNSLMQLENYLNQKEQILELYKDSWSEGSKPKWVGVLVGTEISGDLRDKLFAGYEYKGIPVAGITMKRYRGQNNEILVISETYFKYKYSSKDYSKFTFNGAEYNKGKLVNSVIRHYVENNPETSYAKLKSLFPNSVQGSFGVFDTKAIANDIFEKTGYKRFYINPDEEIRLSDTVICTCNEWNFNNIKSFIKQADFNGLKIEVK